MQIKRTKIMRIINVNAVRGRLSKNCLTQKFIARNICNVKYSRFTVIQYCNVVVMLQCAKHALQKCPQCQIYSIKLNDCVYCTCIVDGML